MSNRWLVIILSAMAVLIAAAVETALIRFQVVTDVLSHIFVAEAMANGGPVPPHPLYFWVLEAAAQLLSPTHDGFLACAIAIMALSVSAKFFVSTRIGEQILTRHGSPDRRVSPWVYAGLFAILFAHALPRTPFYYWLADLPYPVSWIHYCVYIGRTSCASWHNSTNIFLYPLSLGLFYSAFRVLQSQVTVAGCAWLVGLAVLNLLTKPSFVMTLAAVFPLAAFARFRFKTPFWVAVSFSGFVGMLLAAQAMVVMQKGGVAIDPFAVWAPISPLLPLDLLACYAYPLLLLFLRPRAALGQLVWRFAALLAVAGLAISMLLVETGDRAKDGNFFWQIHICTFILFLTTLIAQAAERARRTGNDWKDWVLYIVLSLHSLTGMAYIGRMLITKTL